MGLIAKIHVAKRDIEIWKLTTEMRHATDSLIKEAVDGGPVRLTPGIGSKQCTAVVESLEADSDAKATSASGAGNA